MGDGAHQQLTNALQAGQWRQRQRDVCWYVQRAEGVVKATSYKGQTI